MTFLNPWLLLLVLPVIGLAAGYVYLQLRRRHYAVTFTNLDLLAAVVPKRPGWRRHVPAALVGVGLALLAVGLAQPAHETAVPQETSVVMLTLDVSKSMDATDIAPSRLAAASEAAKTFVNELPDGQQIGLVTFSNSARVVVPPTTNKAQMLTALDSLQAEAGTATGQGILAALSAIDQARVSAGLPTGDGSTNSGAIVLISDGTSQLGVPVDVAAQQAADQGVPISTITFGTDSGVVQLPDGRVQPVPPDPAAMQEVAEITGGTAFDAQSLGQLNSVYSQIQGEVGFTQQVSPLWQWFVALAFVLLLVASGAGLYWSGRIL